MKVCEYMVPDEKHCSVCGELKSIENFSTEKRASDGKSSSCKKCVGVYQREWYAKNCEKQRKNSRYWKTRNPERNHRNTIKVNHGITGETYDGMYASQKGCCAICGTHQSLLKRRLAVDHCHTEKHIRGLLCPKCNTGLGLFKDNVQSLERAICYLKNSFDRVP